MRLLSLVCICLTLVGLTRGASAEKRVALVVGNSAYAHAPALANPLNDAREVTAALKATGFEVVEAVDADKLRLDAALRSFAEKLDAAEVALFFYAGHGLQLGLQNYLVPVDAKLAQERDLEFEAVKLDFVLRQMEIDRAGKTSIVILDACRDNPLARNLARSMGTRSTSIGRGLAAASTGLGTFIAYATQPGNVALDGAGKNSPFTAALVRHMRVKGRNLPATMIEVRKDVVAATDGKQVPWDHSSLTGDFYFIPTDANPQQGSVARAPAGSSDDLEALKARLAKLEAEAGAKERTAGAGKGEMIAADGIRLAELRARAASLDDTVKDLQKKLMTTRMEEGRTSDPKDKQKLQREVSSIMLDWTRRGQDLKKLREEIAALEGKAATQTAPPAEAGSIPPVTPRPDANASASSFETADGVRLEGASIRSFRAPNPDACRNACAAETGCIGFQHGRKIPVMGQCEMFSSIDSRHEDPRWRSGVRKRGLDGAVREHEVLPEPREKPSGRPSRTKQGFDFYDGFTAVGKAIKSAEADNADGCMIICRNTEGCTAASFSQLSPTSKPMCIAFESVQSTAAHALSGTAVVMLRR